ncbi:hypothetical protein [Acidaminococcus intestini]|nr:hypothetical protein [Acidaminococcus intestini]
MTKQTKDLVWMIVSLGGLAPYPDAAPYAGRTRCFGRLFVIAHDVDHHFH